jgi:hypothetical protein
MNRIHSLNRDRPILRFACRLLAAILVLSPCVIRAEEPPLKLKQDLFRVTFPVHIQGGFAEDAAGLSRPHVENLRVAPKVSHRSTVLSEPVYDVREILHGSGLEGPPGSVLLYSPSSQLLFARLTPDDLVLLENLLQPGAPLGRANYWMDIKISKQGGPEDDRKIFEAKSVGIQPGRMISLEARGVVDIQLQAETVLEPDAESWSVSTVCTIGAKGKSVKFVSAFDLKTSASAPHKTVFSQKGSEPVAFEIRVMRDMEWFNPELSSPEAKAKAMKEIEAALKE